MGVENFIRPHKIFGSIVIYLWNLAFFPVRKENHDEIVVKKCVNFQIKLSVWLLCTGYDYVP